MRMRVGKALHLLLTLALLGRTLVLLYKRRVRTKSAEEQAEMRIAGRRAAELLEYIDAHVEVGVSTGTLDRLCARYTTEVLGAVSAPLNYGGILDLGAGFAFPAPLCTLLHSAAFSVGMSPLPLCGFPKSTCISVNDVVCHGVPGDGPEHILREDDIVNIDVTVITAAGYHGDTSRMWVVGDRGNSSSVGARLVADTRRALWLGIRAVAPGQTVGDIGAVIGAFARGRNYGVVDVFFGHGIGRHFHEGPMVLHDAAAGSGEVIREGMIFTIEPMLNSSPRKDIRVLEDQWTAVTVDGALSAQWEHTILVTHSGFEVLTLRSDERESRTGIGGPNG
jgi:methionyl aminopeptidase